MASQAQAYQRSPFEPVPDERTSHLLLPFSSSFAAAAQGIFVPAAGVSMKFEATRST